MSKDSRGNDLSAVRVPITGKFAWAPLDEANVVTAADGGDPAFVLSEDYPAYKVLGLFKKDGGREDTAETSEATEFFQEGYKLIGDTTAKSKVTIAESSQDNIEFVRGLKFDSNHHAYVSDAFRMGQFIGFAETLFRNGDIERMCGVAQIVAATDDKDERGTPKGTALEIEWMNSPLFGGAKYSRWSIPATPATPGA